MPERFGDAHIQEYLATREVVVLATVLPSGAPLLTAMWFLHDSQSLAMISVDGLTKVRNLRRDPRLSVLAESGTRRDVRSVMVQGRAEFLGDTAERQTLVDRFQAKYRPDLERLWGGRTMPANRVMFRVVVRRVHSMGLTG